MLIKRGSDIIPSSEITPEAEYMNRRKFISRLGVGAAAAAGGTLLGESPLGAQQDELTPLASITSHNNFYEFGVEKTDPARNARNFRVRPWTVRVDGHVAKPTTYALEDLLKPHAPQERVYRLRCVEAWSMVIPWQGVPLRDIITRLEPTSQARYVAFETLEDPTRMPGQRSNVLDWPYREGLRMDEAMHPLTLLAVGIYNQPLLGQNGAPIRLVVPWKYGFKSIKSIVRISFTDREPTSTWKVMAPQEYGFYANVNPEVDHPRWSQARERRIGELRRRPTLMFNGYADQVASLYSGMDLREKLLTEKVLEPARDPAGKRVRGSRDRLPLARISLVLTLIPLGLILFDIANGTLGADPVEALRRRTGWWSLTLLIATLAVSPLRRLTGWSRVIQVRKTVGVMAFVYALLHFVVYVTIDQWFALSYIIEDIVDRPFITAGFISFLMLIPLAITSRRDSIRKLGGKRWQQLHRLIYPAAALGVLHYYWLVKADTTKPVIFAVILTVLLLLRVVLPTKARKGVAAGKAANDALV